MKILFTIFLLVAGSVVGRKFDSDESSSKIVIDRNTTEAGLMKIIEQGKSVNINLTIDEAGYNSKGKLKKIKGKVDFGEGGSGTFQSDRMGKIIIKRDLNSGNGGFSIVVKKRWI